MGKPVLVTIELRFKTSEDPGQVGDRIREAVRLIVGPEEVEDYRLRTVPLTEPPKPRPV